MTEETPEVIVSTYKSNRKKCLWGSLMEAEYQALWGQKCICQLHTTDT